MIGKPALLFGPLEARLAKCARSAALEILQSRGRGPPGQADLGHHKKLLGGGAFTEAAHAFLQFLAQRRRSVWIEGDQIPQRLRTVAAEAR